MRLPLPPEILLPVLLLVFAALAALLAPGPLRRAFLAPGPDLQLAKDEVVLADLRPARPVMAMLALLVLAALIAAALALQISLRADPLLAYLSLSPFGLAALLLLYGESRARWQVTDRRVVTGLGAALPLAEIGRITVGPALLQLHGRGPQSLRLLGLADPPGTAALICGALRR